MNAPLFPKALVIVRGGGDLGSGVIYRLVRAGFPVMTLERDVPTFVRRAVCFGDAVYSRSLTVEGVTATRVDRLEDIPTLLAEGVVPVLIDPAGESLRRFEAAALVDARMEKHNIDTTLHDAPFVVALGPGFTAGADCHAVIETNRGHDLGRVLWEGSAEPDTGEPGPVAGYTHSRVLRAPAAGHVRAHFAIGDAVAAGAVIAEVGGCPLTAPFSGVLRGIVHEQVVVSEVMKIGDLDPRAQRRHCFTISDKSLAVGGGALEALLSAPAVRARLR